MTKKQNQTNRKIIYVMQGGGALGSFQVGGVEALHEHGYAADMLVGISIGGINASIIAGNPPKKQLEKLHDFWERITTHIPFPNLSIKGTIKVQNFWGAFLSLAGQPNFYMPRTVKPFLISNQTPDQLSFYDTTPLRNTLSDLIDFDYLNQGHVRLCLGATDLESGEFVFFDSTKDKITVDHIMASAALPPGFPAVKIDGRYYVDGGVYANTPLSFVIEEFAHNEENMKNVLCFMFDLFSAQGPLPHSMDGMLERIKDIQYSSHTKRSNAIYATSQNLSHAINILGKKLPPEVKQDPAIKEILKLGLAHRLDLVHLIYHSPQGTELDSKDYNFSANACDIHWQQGYDNTTNLIKEKSCDWESLHELDSTTVYTMTNGKPLTIKI